MKNNFTKSILICLMMTSFFACQKGTQPTLTSEAGKKETILSTPLLTSEKSSEATITITVTAGATGAPAGFSVQWMKADDYNALNKVWPTDGASTPASFCKASFSGVPGASSFNIGAGGTASVEIGAYLYDLVGASSSCATSDLECGTAYVFRSFAHTDPAKGGKAKSNWSETFTASTSVCPVNADCGHHLGYWKDNVWPASVQTNGATLGNVSYTFEQLQNIINAPAGGNSLINLAHMLIVDKLNYANGLRGPYEAVMAQADALVGSKDILTGDVSAKEIAQGINGQLNVLAGSTCDGN